MAWRQHAAIQSRGQHFPVDKTIGTPPLGARQREQALLQVRLAHLARDGDVAGSGHLLFEPADELVGVGPRHLHLRMTSAAPSILSSVWSPSVVCATLRIRNALLSTVASRIRKVNGNP